MEHLNTKLGRRAYGVLAAVLICAGLMSFSAGESYAQSPPIIMEEMRVPASDPGIEIYVRNKRAADLTSFRPERTVLFVHGATYPAHTAFDLKLDGLSWMDYIAARGYDVYLLDIRGYGKSTRPKEMEDKPEANSPIVRGDTAVKDISTVVDFILKRRNIPRLNLIGWSWGTTLMATYTTQNAAKVERLVLYAPAWIRTTPSPVQSSPALVLSLHIGWYVRTRHSIGGSPECLTTRKPTLSRLAGLTLGPMPRGRQTQSVHK